MRRSRSIAGAMAALCAIAFAVPAAAQHQHGTKPDSSKQEKPAMKHDMAGMKHDMEGMNHMSSGWKEMDAFHAVLGGTFHPAADKGDFAPLKANAQVLADKAKTWLASTAPASCAKPEQKQTITTIATLTSELAKKVKGDTPDADLKAAITAIHDNFEKVETACGEMKGMKH